MRKMRLKYNDKTIYSSTFDEKTGAIVRIVETARDSYHTPWEEDNYNSPKDRKFEARYEARRFDRAAFSPVPETVDVGISSYCNFACSYCYTDSGSSGRHAPADLAEKIIKGFDAPPYQMAIGGGEPTLHPDFPAILRRVRELGTVPNYTTNGSVLKPEVVAATNEVCGGVAMTFHAFKGLDWFLEHYKRLRETLNVQVNVHLIADRDVATNLRALAEHAAELGKFRVVLLAYYPDVGRASMSTLITKKVYTKEFPDALKVAQEAGFDFAFSEGLLPYFLSRPNLSVNTDFAMRSEGLFSCYVDPAGHMSHSSFSPPRGTSAHQKGETIYSLSSQKLWDRLRGGYGPSGNNCYRCANARKCSTPEDFHYLICEYASNNSTGGAPRAPGRGDFYL